MIATAAVTTTAATAEAAPNGADVRSAVRSADASLASSVQSVQAGNLGVAAEQIAETQALELRASRVARRVASHSGPVKAARHLRRAASSLDRGFSTYAGLLPGAPPELQVPLVDALTRLDGARGQVFTELNSLVNVLPPEIRENVLGAIEAFQSTGDLPALIAAIGDPETRAAIRAHLGELIDQVVASLQAKLDSPAGADLPPETVEQLQAVIVLIQVNRAAIIAGIDDVLTSGGQMPTLSPAMCRQLQLVFGQLEVPVPAGVCATS